MQQTTQQDSPTRVILAAVFATLIFAGADAHAATYQWNKNLTSGDTTSYNLLDPTNWLIDGIPGTAGGNPPGSSDDVVVPNGITARWTDPGTTPQWSFKSLAIGSGAAGATQVLLSTNYSSSNTSVSIAGNATGDPDNNASTRAFDRISGPRSFNWTINGPANVSNFNTSELIITNPPAGGLVTFSGVTNKVQFEGAIGVRTVELSGTVLGRFDLRARSNTVTHTMTLDLVGPTNINELWFSRRADPNDSAQIVKLNSFDHMIGDISGAYFSTGSYITADAGGSVTLTDWSKHEFKNNTDFDLSQITVNMFGATDDTGIVLSVRGRDDGSNAAATGLVDNFALGTLVVGDDAADVVTLRTDGAYTIGSFSSDAALYVNVLDLTSGASLVIPEGIKLYYMNLLGDTSNVDGIERLGSSAIPEPVSGILLGLGAVALLNRRNRRK